MAGTILNDLPIFAVLRTYRTHMAAPLHLTLALVSPFFFFCLPNPLLTSLFLVPVSSSPALFRIRLNIRSHSGGFLAVCAPEPNLSGPTMHLHSLLYICIQTGEGQARPGQAGEEDEGRGDEAKDDDIRERSRRSSSQSSSPSSSSSSSSSFSGGQVICFL